MSELPNEEQLKVNMEGIIRYFEGFTQSGEAKDIPLHDPVVEADGNSYQLHIDYKGRLAMSFHSGESTVGHAAETSQRDFDYYRGKREGDEKVGWRYMTYPFEAVRWTDEHFALPLARSGLTAETFTRNLANHVNPRHA